MTLASVIPASDKVPGVFMKVSLGVGPATAADAPRKILLFGNKTSAGSAVVEKVYAVVSADDAETLFGIGSELYIMARAALRANPSAALFAIVMTASVGVSASGTVTITGPATAAGSVSAFILGEEIVAAVASGDTATTIASALAAAINARTDLPVTASPAAGVVTITFRHGGPRGNRTSLRTSANATAGVTATASAAYLASGATSDSPANALDAIAVGRYHYLVAPYDDSTNINLFRTHVQDEAGPTIGHREQVVGASIDTLANATTLATAVNESRIQVAWHYNADDLPSVIASTLAGLRAAQESSDPAANLDGLILTRIKPQNTDADRPEYAELVSALNNGLTALLPDTAGNVTITRSITSRSRDAAGNANYNVLDTSKVTVPDFMADDITVGFAAEFSQFKLAPDDEDGEPPPAGAAIATPSTIRDWIEARLVGYQETGLIVNVAANLPSLVVEIGATSGRVNASIPADVIEGLHQFAGDVRQIG